MYPCIFSAGCICGDVCWIQHVGLILRYIRKTSGLFPVSLLFLATFFHRDDLSEFKNLYFVFKNIIEHYLEIDDLSEF